MALGIIVKEIRKELNITQEQLAHDLKVSFSTLNRWENNHTVPSRLARIRIIEYCTMMRVNVATYNLLDLDNTEEVDHG